MIMSGDEKRQSEDAVADAGSGPGLVYQCYVQMEDLLDKLKLLHYEQTFCRQLGFKPFSRHYFALATNPGEQFFSFTSIAAWLLQMCGRHFEQPQEYDDPNATISSILDQVRQCGHTPDFPPSKLKTGCGEQCIWVLDRLADEALKAKSFTWKRAIYPEEEMDEDNIIEDDAELNLNTVDENMLKDDDDDDEEFEDEENIMGLDDLKKLGKKQELNELSKPEEIMQSNTDASEWQMEVERVLPQLKVTLRADNKDWRVHVEQMHTHQTGINNALAATKNQLERLENEATRALEKVTARERYLNSQLEPQLADFRLLQDQLAETRERYRQASGGVTDRTGLLSQVSEELERVKMEMEERGSTMTDGAPLVKVKQATQKLKAETTQMDIRIGVVQHILLQAKLKEKNEQNLSIVPDSHSEYNVY